MIPAPPSPVSLATPHRGVWPAALSALALACALLSVAVFFQRGATVWQIGGVAPGVAVTSGYENESLFAFWRAAHGQPVYADSTRLPYAAAYFNWLFYAAYALPVNAAAGHYGDAAIPRTGRLTTAIGALFGAASLFWLLSRALPGRFVISAALATFVFFGPLVGLWAHTVRPDVWAFALETAAVAVLLLGFRRHALATALAAAVLFYGAWAFKQNYILGLGAACAFLGLRRQWIPTVVLVLVSVVLWALTFACADESYLASFRSTVATNVFSLSVGSANALDMLRRSAPLWLLAACLLVRPRSHTAPPLPPALADLRLLALVGLGLALPLSFAGSCKVGAASNYYFTSTLMLSLLAALALHAGSKLTLAGLTAALGLQGLVFTGLAGHGQLPEQARDLAVTWQAWSPQPEPRFSCRTTLNLPWLSPGSPPIVLAFNYDLERTAQRTFESDGVGGLIAQGYFRSLLLPTHAHGHYDGANAHLHYRPVQTVGEFTIFRRTVDQP